MAQPANLITITLSDASTKLIFIRNQTFNWSNGHMSVQWAEAVVGGQTWVRAPGNVDAAADVTTTQAASVTYMALSLANQLAQLNTFFVTYYNAIITANAILNI